MNPSSSLATVSLSILLSFACKSYHPTPGLRESLARHKDSPKIPVTSNPSNDEATDLNGDLPANTLLISKLKLPSEVARYNRSCVVVHTKGTADVTIKDYKLNTPIDLEPFQDYTITVELYLDNALVYSNAYCDTNRTFNANLGRNIFTVPVCPEDGEDTLSTPACMM